MYAFKPFVLTRIESTSELKPKARSGHRIVCDSSNLYSYGGYNPSLEYEPDDSEEQRSPLFKELWRFNLTTRQWKILPGRKNLPNELASPAVVLRAGKLIIYGGTATPFGEKCNNRLYVCDLDNGNTVALNARGSLPDPQYGQALICHGSYLYTIGGTTGFDYSCDIYRIDLKTGLWESVYVCSGHDLNEPQGRYRHEVAYDGKMIYILGGGTSHDSFGFTEIPAFDLESNKWSLLKTHGDVNNNPWVPGPRRCHGSVQYTDPITGDVNVVLSGGYRSDQVYNDVWRLNLRRLQWTCLKPLGTTLPRPLFFHSAALTPAGQMYVFGGIQDFQTGPRTQDVLSVWLLIPKLSEICWEALGYYKNNWKNTSRNDLINLGIPRKFVERIQFNN
ncbi:hypothetical protein PV327_007600 [Microctonus hyperodae]|uniref:Kelch domain-containing protein 10 n=1 Tax=Microctonus hyperodae TaxID=165561 RepID=A0AA39KYV9_MICHY|nr:hypothetical protein PV327_007600 [Microctonus hyperodae]